MDQYLNKTDKWLYEVTGVTIGEDSYAPNLLNAPREWFYELPDWWEDSSQYSIRVGEDGRVAGLIANFGACYLNWTHECFTPIPVKEDEDFVYQGDIYSKEGDLVPVSILAATKGHHYSDSMIENVLANQGFLDDEFQPLQNSNDIMGHQLMYGRYKNTPQGIAFLGAVFPHVSKQMVNRINASAVSAHWQYDVWKKDYMFLGAVFVNHGALPLSNKTNLELSNIAASKRYNHIMATEKQIDASEHSNCKCKEVIAAIEEVPETTLESLAQGLAENTLRIEALEAQVVSLGKIARGLVAKEEV